MALVSDIIQGAFEEIAVVQPGEAISTAMQTNSFPILNGLLDTLSAERYSVFTQMLEQFQLQPNTSSYTLGVGGSFGTSVRAQRAESWEAVFFGFRTGGQILSFPEYQSRAIDPIGSTSSIPRIVGADEAWPLINVRVFPTPSNNPGAITIAFWTQIAQFATVGDTINLPPGWFNMLRLNLAVLLYPRYSRVGGMSPELASNAQNSKASLVQQNAPTPTPGQAQ